MRYRPNVGRLPNVTLDRLWVDLLYDYTVQRRRDNQTFTIPSIKQLKFIDDWTLLTYMTILETAHERFSIKMELHTIPKVGSRLKTATYIIPKNIIDIQDITVSGQYALVKGKSLRGGAFGQPYELWNLNFTKCEEIPLPDCSLYLPENIRRRRRTKQWLLDTNKDSQFLVAIIQELAPTAYQRHAPNITHVLVFSGLNAPTFLHRFQHFNLRDAVRLAVTGDSKRSVLVYLQKNHIYVFDLLKEVQTLRKHIPNLSDVFCSSLDAPVGSPVIFSGGQGIRHCVDLKICFDGEKFYIENFFDYTNFHSLARVGEWSAWRSKIGEMLPHFCPRCQCDLINVTDTKVIWHIRNYQKRLRKSNPCQPKSQAVNAIVTLDYLAATEAHNNDRKRKAQTSTG
jgi:hypothetical protein